MGRDGTCEMQTGWLKIEHGGSEKKQELHSEKCTADGMGRVETNTGEPWC